MENKIVNVLERDLCINEMKYEGSDVILDIYEDREQTILHIISNIPVVEKYNTEIYKLEERERKGYLEDYEDLIFSRMLECSSQLYKFGICDGVDIFLEGLKAIDNSNLLNDNEANKYVIEKILTNRVKEILKAILNEVEIKKYDKQLSEMEEKINKIYKGFPAMLEMYKQIKKLTRKRETIYYEAIYKYGVYEILKIISQRNYSKKRGETKDE